MAHRATRVTNLAQLGVGTFHSLPWGVLVAGSPWSLPPELHILGRNFMCQGALLEEPRCSGWLLMLTVGSMTPAGAASQAGVLPRGSSQAPGAAVWVPAGAAGLTTASAGQGTGA